MFALIEAIVRAHLVAETGHGAGTSTPPDLEQRTDPFHRVSRAGGADDGITDAPLVDVETFAPSRHAAAQAAEEARAAMHALKANAVVGTLVDTVDTATGPVWLDYANPAVHRYVATYRLTLRRP